MKRTFEYVTDNQHCKPPLAVSCCRRTAAAAYRGFGYGVVAVFGEERVGTTPRNLILHCSSEGVAFGFAVSGFFCAFRE
jgi:hypothetical protein